jgi:hypothetical protein
MKGNSNENGDFPKWWDFDEDGLRLTLDPFEHFNQATVNGREVTIAVGVVDAVERSVFLWPEGGLYGRFRDHVKKRPTKRIEAGERITIERSADKRPSRTTEGRNVWGWAVSFHDAPEPSQEDLFGLNAREPSEEEAPPEADDDSIPF